MYIHVNAVDTFCTLGDKMIELTFCINFKFISSFVCVIHCGSSFVFKVSAKIAKKNHRNRIKERQNDY
jgi:hypothetical protein